MVSGSSPPENQPRSCKQPKTGRKRAVDVRKTDTEREGGRERGKGRERERERER
jgi:hypothetical protein